MADYEAMTEDELQALQSAANRRVNDLRAEERWAEARELRDEVLRIAAVKDRKADVRVAEMLRNSDQQLSVEVAGEAAAAVSEAERLLGGKE